jgi:hypothetical protein
MCNKSDLKVKEKKETMESSNSNSNSNSNKCHPALKSWSRLYEATPKIYLPFTEFDIGFVLVSLSVCSSFRLLSEFLFINVLKFNPNTYKTVESAGGLTSMAHAIVLLFGLYHCLISQPYIPSAKIQGTPIHYQNSVSTMLQMCTGYMLYDLFFMARANNWTFHEDDIAFCGHHVVTMLYMSQCRVLGVGHISAMGLMFTGEFSNPLQNGHLVTKFAIQQSHLSPTSFFHIIHPFVEYAFAVVYAIMRGIVGPIQIHHIAYDLLFTKQGKANVPIVVSIIWSIMIFGIIGGSLPWTMECIDMLKDGLKVKYDESWDYGPRYADL